VRQSIARIKNSPFIPRTDSVRGFVYDVHTGQLNEVDGPSHSSASNGSAGAGAVAEDGYGRDALATG
jgi:hypothetical protein